MLCRPTWHRPKVPLTCLPLVKTHRTDKSEIVQKTDYLGGNKIVLERSFIKEQWLFIIRYNEAKIKRERKRKSDRDWYKCAGKQRLSLQIDICWQLNVYE
jgi:hypothetical protein